MCMNRVCPLTSAHRSFSIHFMRFQLIFAYILLGCEYFDMNTRVIFDMYRSIIEQFIYLRSTLTVLSALNESALMAVLAWEIAEH